MVSSYRGRATKDGKLQEELTWHNITIATGEDPLSSESSSGGVKSRTLEIYGKPIDDEELASRMHGKSEEAYGTSGPAFIQKIITQIKDQPDTVKNEFKAIRDEMKKRFPENVDSHISSVAAVLLADAYMNMWLFGTEEGQAVNETISLGEQILGLLEKKEDTDDAKRAYDAFLSWYSVHQFYFNTGSKDVYGWQEEEILHIYPTQFKKAMKDLGFNDTRIRKDWADRGWIEVEEEGNKRRTTVRKSNELSKKQERVVAVKLDANS